EAHGEARGAKEQEGADDLIGKRLADAAGVGEEEIALERLQVAPRDADARQLAEAGGDAVGDAALLVVALHLHARDGEARVAGHAELGGVALAQHGVDAGAGEADALAGGGGERDAAAPARDVDDVLHAELLLAQAEGLHGGARRGAPDKRFSGGGGRGRGGRLGRGRRRLGKLHEERRALAGPVALAPEPAAVALDDGAADG